MFSALRDSVRAWRRSPGVAVIATLSLALGIGATTTCFAIVDRLLLRTLEVPDPDQLVQLTTEEQPLFSRVTLPVWEQIQQRSHLYASAFASTGGRAVNLAPQGEADMVTPVWATGRVFETLRVGPLVGRLFDERDDAPDGGPDGFVAVISHAFWKRRFGAAPDVVGRTLTVERVPVTIIGVLPASLPGFTVGTGFDLVLPLRTEPRLNPPFSAALNTRFPRFRVVMRLAPGRPAEAVETALRADQPVIRVATLPASLRRAEDREAFLRSPFVVAPAADGGSGARSYYGEPAAIALGLAVLVLLACCGNVATALLAHGARRQYELSVRAALGASRWEAGRQLLADSLLLSLLGAAAALILAKWAGAWLLTQWSNDGLEAWLASGTNWRVWVVASLTGVVTGVLCGLAAAWRAARVGPADNLKTHGPGHSSAERAQRVLVVAQLAFAVVVIVTSTLLMRSYAGIASSSALRRLEGVVAVELRLARSNVAPEAREEAAERVRASVARLPGVVASVAMTAPFFGAGIFEIINAPDLPGLTEEDRMVLGDSVGPSHFDTLGIRLVSGRDFYAGDVPGSPVVGIVNQTFVRKYFGGEFRAPRRVGFVREKTVEDVVVVGVVEDAPYESVEEPVIPLLYRVRTQHVPFSDTAYVFVRSQTGGGKSPTDISAAVKAAAPELSFALRRYDDYLRRDFARERLLAIIAGFFVVLSTILAGLGVFGVMSYAVTSRHRELGIRLALGARAGQVLRMVLARAGTLVVIGGAAGLMVSWWATTLVASLLHGTPPRDATAFGAGAVLILVIGLAAAWIPARTAARTDAAVVLRES